MPSVPKTPDDDHIGWCPDDQACIPVEQALLSMELGGPSATWNACDVHRMNEQNGAVRSAAWDELQRTRC